MNVEYTGFVPLTLTELNTLTEELSRLLGTQYPPVIIPGEAILGIEAVAAGIAAPGRTILNIVTGPYGSLFGQWLERGGANVVEVKVPFDQVVTVEAVAAAIEQYQPVALSFVQAEVVTGGSNPAEDIFRLARKHDLITVTDSVSAVGEKPCLWMSGRWTSPSLVRKKRSPDPTESVRSVFHRAAGPSWRPMNGRRAIPFCLCWICGPLRTAQRRFVYRRLFRCLKPGR